MIFHERKIQTENQTRGKGHRHSDKRCARTRRYSLARLFRLARLFDLYMVGGVIMFIHGKTKQPYYSVKDKIKYYSKRAYNDMTVTPEQKQHAIKRLAELRAIDKLSYTEPTMIVTDDKHFGNGISKPRLCVAVKSDNKGRVLVAPIMPATSKYVVLDNDINRQISNTADGRNKWVNRSEIYEDKYVTPHAELTKRDKEKIKRIFR